MYLNLNEKVYAFVTTIPEGKVVTYGQIAEHLGNKNLARVVGNILHHNPNPAKIPCHRVVNGKGEVSKNYAFGGANAQRARLAAEGILLDAKGRINLQEYGWMR